MRIEKPPARRFVATGSVLVQARLAVQQAAQALSACAVTGIALRGTLTAPTDTPR
jgi:hypothetical protein